MHCQTRVYTFYDQLINKSKTKHIDTCKRHRVSNDIVTNTGFVGFLAFYKNCEFMYILSFMKIFEVRTF